MKKIALAIIVISLIASCAKSDSSAKLMSSSAGGTGQGGSLAQFTIVGNYVYAVSMHYLYTVDISNPAAPVKKAQTPLNFDMETIYPYRNRLFVGSRTGLYIYSIDNPANPVLIGEAKHGRSCDPVVANDSVSYTTLKGSSACGPATSGLYVHDVRNLSQPLLVKTINMNNPAGLGMADSALYVCNGSEGLKVFSIAAAYNPVEKETIAGSSFVDVIPYHDILVCWIEGGIALYDISNRLHPVFVKKIVD